MADAGTLRRRDAVPATTAAAGTAWLGAAAYAVALLAVFHGTAWSMVAIWLRSETFAHGFLILPIAGWLAWRDRAALSRLPAQPAPRVLLLTLGAGAGWLLATLVDVLVVQQLALVALLVTGLWAILGTPIARRLAFPLGFLFLAVPMGQGLEEPMMDLTAEWTVRLIRATGIPVYQEGRYFQLPSGNWSVVEACSGVRYLIASFTLGLIYAYITYRSAGRRLLFVAASLVVPVVANVLRAWGIVMIGHFSGMRYATGVDHLIYGWVFFGVVMLLLFWVGGYWQQAPAADEDASTASAAAAAGGPPRARAPAVALLAFVCAAAAPALGLAMGGTAVLAAATPLAPPPAASGWRRDDATSSGWRPRERGADRTAAAAYRADDAAVTLFMQQYLDQRQGAELVGHGDPWEAQGAGWRVVGRGSAGDFPAAEVTLSHPDTGARLLAWSWYRVDGRDTASDYLAKLLEARLQLRFAPRRGARLFVVTPVGEDPATARARLAQFVARHEAALDTALATGLRKAGPREAGAGPREPAAAP